MRVPDPRHGIARVLSKLGLCSRSQAEQWVRAGRVTVDGRRVLDPERPVRAAVACISVDGVPVRASQHHYLMLNKPRGLVTTRDDERGRDTVYACLADAGLPWLAPIGRLDKASEGLLLFSNDTGWAAGITAPATGPDKTYHVQIDAVPDHALLERLRAGARVDGEQLGARSVRVLRTGARNAWLEVVLDEGRNRQIRRLLQAHGLATLRLVRVAIGPLALGDLPKGRWRELSPAEVAALRPSARPARDRP